VGKGEYRKITHWHPLFARFVSGKRKKEPTKKKRAPFFLLKKRTKGISATRLLLLRWGWGGDFGGRKEDGHLATYQEGGGG